MTPTTKSLESESPKDINVNFLNYLRISFNFLSSLGLWAPEYAGAKGTLYALYTVLSVVVMAALPTLSEVIYLFLVINDVELFAKGIFFSITRIVWIMRMYTIFGRHTDMKNLYNRMKDPIFSLIDKHSGESGVQTMTQNYKYSRVYFVISIMACVSWTVLPLLNPVVVLPVTCWYPFDQNKWFTYVYVYQILSTLYFATTNTAFDTLWSGTMAFACDQLTILSDKLADKHDRVLHVVLAGERSEDPDQSTVNRESILKDHLKSCVELHLQIIRFVEDFKKMFAAHFFIQFFASCVTICFTAFQLSAVDNLKEFFMLLMYLNCMLAQLSIVSYFGNEVILKSTCVGEAAYSSKWYESGIGNRRTIFIIMERAKRPIEISALIVTYSLATFVSVLRSSYSYYSVLKSVNN